MKLVANVVAVASAAALFGTSHAELTASARRRMDAINANSPLGEEVLGQWMATKEGVQGEECAALWRSINKRCNPSLLRSAGVQSAESLEDDGSALSFDDGGSDDPEDVATCLLRFECSHDKIASTLLDDLISADEIEPSRIGSSVEQELEEEEEEEEPLEIASSSEAGDSKETRGASKQNPWGVRRIEKADLPLLKQGQASKFTGKGVNIYMVDTGVLGSHKEFAGRYQDGLNTVRGESNVDENGHGTHTAGTAAGSTVGVAEQATIIGVKVFGKRGTGPLADVAKGIHWAVSNQKKKHSGQAAVINLSLSASKSKAIDSAVTKAIKAGMIVVVAAGNLNRDACNYSPARQGGTASSGGRGLITVMASDNKDRRSSFSNYGPCTDIIAPGTNIPSAWKSGGYKTMSGTSMAAPHVAGVAAQLLEEFNFNQKAAQAELFKDAARDKISDIQSNSKNLLVQAEL